MREGEIGAKFSIRARGRDSGFGVNLAISVASLDVRQVNSDQKVLERRVMLFYESHSRSEKRINILNVPFLL